jgi:hypothetical protein
MARYSAFLGFQVEVQYRAGDILLPASGTFVGDTGRSIFLEQTFEVRGQRRQFRWEIPYQYIVRLAEKTDSAAAAIDDKRAGSEAQAPETTEELTSHEESKNASAAAAGFTSSATLIFPRPQGSNV